jgi:hypothetical protein
MAANPQIPPSEPPLERRTETVPAADTGKHFPWSVIAIIATIVALGLIAYYFFR